MRLNMIPLVRVGLPLLLLMRLLVPGGSVKVKLPAKGRAQRTEQTGPREWTGRNLEARNLQRLVRRPESSLHLEGKKDVYLSSRDYPKSFGSSPLLEDSLDRKAMAGPIVGPRSAQSVVLVSIAALASMGFALVAHAEANRGLDTLNFNPVCPASDGVFRLGQRAAVSLAGDQNVEDYRPLINDVLIRVRTELCVLESFVRETALPFVQKKGFGWILPIRESSETYVAGVVFVVGANFILLGSTKVLAILSIYHDILLGLPTRFVGGVLNAVANVENDKKKNEEQLKKLVEDQFKEVQKAMESSSSESRVKQINERYSERMEKMRTTQQARRKEKEERGINKAANLAAGVSVPLRIYGQFSLTTKRVLEAFDTFCSRYLVALTVVYTLLKSVHFWIFPDFP